MTTLASLPTEMARVIALTACAAGTLDHETGGFVIANDHGQPVTLALTGERGIERASNLFRVSTRAVATLFDWVAQRQLTVSAQWHSHRLGAFLSDADVRYGFNVTGFHTCVVPNYTRPSNDPKHWGWWTFDGHHWNRMDPPAPCRSTFSVITFQEGEIYEH